VTDRRALNPRTAQDADTRATGEFKRALAAIFLGDWHPLLRDPLDLFRLSFLVGAVVFAVQGDWDAVVRLVVPCLLVFLIRALELPRPIDWVFCLAMAFQGWGNALHLFSQFWWYDNTVHITLPMSLAPILYIGPVTARRRARAGATRARTVRADRHGADRGLPRRDGGKRIRDLRMGRRPLVRPAPVHRRDRHHHRPRRRFPGGRARRAAPRRLGAGPLHEPPASHPRRAQHADNSPAGEAVVRRRQERAGCGGRERRRRARRARSSCPRRPA
jgi:hypothetical protein